MGIPLFNVLKPGIQTTVQDLGRYGYQQFGVSPSGAMDNFAMRVANILVGNDPEEAVLEASLSGPKLEAICDCIISICGGNLSPILDNNPTPLWKSFHMYKGQVLEFGKPAEGARAYIAIGGGIDVPAVLGSKSTYLAGGFGGTEGRPLKKEDIINGANPGHGTSGRRLSPVFIPRYTGEITARVIPGPHLEAFHPASVEEFFSKSFMVSPNSNRMGISLTGPKISHISGADILSDAIPFGGIQVPSGGQPIILMSERQPTGGYTRIGTVITVDLPLLAQAMPGSKIRFERIEVHEAQQLYKENRGFLRGLELSAGVWQGARKK